MLDTRKVKSLREKLGLSLEDAGNRAELVGLRGWYAVENGVGDVTMSQLDRIAAVLGVEPAELLVKGKKKAPKK